MCPLKCMSIKLLKRGNKSLLYVYPLLPSSSFWQNHNVCPSVPAPGQLCVVSKRQTTLTSDIWKEVVSKIKPKGVSSGPIFKRKKKRKGFSNQGAVTAQLLDARTSHKAGTGQARASTLVSRSEYTGSEVPVEHTGKMSVGKRIQVCRWREMFGLELKLQVSSIYR